MDLCPECGGGAEPGCTELFHRLLALDHSREQPWGPLHGVVVACYRLQHPAALAEREPAVLLDLLRAYTEGGRDALDRLTQGARRANSHRSRSRRYAASTPSTFDAPARFAVTISDVAVDGSFPADGYPERVRSWARATLKAWQG